MNLVWITPEFPSSTSNSKGIYIFRTIKELAKYYKIHVICLYPALPPLLELIKYWKDRKKIYLDWKSNYYNNPGEKVELENVEIFYLRYFRLPRGKFHNLEGFFAYFQSRKYLAEIINNKSILHANWIFPAGTMANIISKKYNVPFLISLLGSDVNRLEEGTRYWKTAKKLLGQADKITAVTKDLFEKCKEKHLDLPDSKLELIDNIYEADKFIILERKQTRELLGLKQELKIIFFAGGLIPLKNVDVLIKAFANILKSVSDVKLYIAGSGTDEGLLKRLTETLNVSKNVCFLGPLLSKDLINFYNAADIFCLPSKSEGLPNVIVESFFCGTPVIASAVGGIPSIVIEGVNGFLVEPNSIKDLSEKLEISLNHSWDRFRIRESISHFFPEKVIEKYHLVYKSISENFAGK